MLVLVDALAHVVGFFVEMALVLLGQVPIVLGHVALFVVLQALLAAFEAGGLSRSELVIFDAVRDAVLLIGFSAVDLVDTRMSGIDLSGAGCGRIVLGSARVRPMSRNSNSDIPASCDIVRRASLTRAGQVRMRHKALVAPDSKYVATMFASNLKRRLPVRREARAGGSCSISG